MTLEQYVMRQQNVKGEDEGAKGGTYYPIQ